MKKKLAVLALIVAAAAVFAVTRYANHRDDGVIVASGTVEVTEARTGFRLPGRIASLHADEGRRVAAGERLAALDSDDLKSSLAQAKAAVSESEARLTELQTGSRPQERAQAKAALAAAEAELSRAERDYQRAETLFAGGAIPAAQFDAARSSRDSRAAQVRTAQEGVSLAQEGPRTEVIAAARQRLSQARAAQGVAEERFREALLVAPFAGVVLRKHVEAGEIVTAGTPVFTIGDLEQPWVKIYVKETQLGLVRLGQKATISVDSFPGRTFEGTVSFIASEAEFTPKNIQTPEERVKLVFAVKVSLGNKDGLLKPGMPADVRITLR